MTEVKEGVVVEFGAKLAPLMAGLNLATAGVGAASAIVVTKLAAWERAAVKTATTWERAMAEIQTITDVTKTGLKGMQKELEGFSVRFGQDFERVARARYDVISSGFTGIADSMTIMEAAGKAAVGGLTDISVSADVLTSVLMAYEMQASEADRVAEKMFKTVVLGKVTFEQLAQNIGDVVSSAHAAGISLDDLFGAFATITLGGVNPAETATALNQLLLSFIAPGKEAKKEIDKLGISLKDGLVPMLQKLSTLDLEALAKITPNVRALKGVLTSVAEGGGRAASNIAAVETSVGSLDRAVGIMAGTTENLNKQLAASKEALRNAFGGEMLPVLVSTNKAFLAWLAEENKVSAKVTGKGVGVEMNEAIWHNLNLPTPEEMAGFLAKFASLRGEVVSYVQEMDRYEYKRSYDSGGLATARVLRAPYRIPSVGYTGQGPMMTAEGDAAKTKAITGELDRALAHLAQTMGELPRPFALTAEMAKAAAASFDEMNHAYGTLNLEKLMVAGRGLNIAGSFRRDRGIGEQGLVGGSYAGEGSFNLRGGGQAGDWTSREWQKTRREMTVTEKLGASIQRDLAYGFESVVGGALSDAFGPGPIAQWAASALSHMASVIAEAYLLKGVMDFLGLPFSLESGGYAGLPGYAWGGFTGGSVRAGGVAGVVHAGEFTLNRQATQAIGVGNLERMNRAGGDTFSVGDIHIHGTQGDVARRIADEISDALPRAIRDATRNGRMRFASNVGRV